MSNSCYVFGFAEKFVCTRHFQSTLRHVHWKTPTAVQWILLAHWRNSEQAADTFLRTCLYFCAELTLHSHPEHYHFLSYTAVLPQTMEFMYSCIYDGLKHNSLGDHLNRTTCSRISTKHWIWTRNDILYSESFSPGVNFHLFCHASQVAKIKPTKILLVHVKTIPTYARYIQVHHWSSPDPPETLETLLLPSVAERLVKRRLHWLIKIQQVKISCLLVRQNWIWRIFCALHCHSLWRNFFLAKIFPLDYTVLKFCMHNCKSPNLNTANI